MKKTILLLFVFILIVTLVGCNSSKEKKKEKEIETSKLQLISQLATVESYYHNVVEVIVPPGKHLINIGEKEKTYWLEYTASCKIGFDIKKVAINVDGDKILITLPHAEILENSVINVDEPIESKDGWNKNPIPKVKIDEAIKEAHQKMMENVAKDENLFIQAKINAKTILNYYIEKMGELNHKNYEVIYLDD